MPDFGVRWRMEARFADRIKLEIGNQPATLKQLRDQILVSHSNWRQRSKTFPSCPIVFGSYPSGRPAQEWVGSPSVSGLLPVGYPRKGAVLVPVCNKAIQYQCKDLCELIDLLEREGRFTVVGTREHS